MNWPKITIVTTSYNQGHYLEQAIRSVLDQGYPNLEYFVVDGGSTDDSVEVIERYADRITWWCSERDGGQPAALNKGFGRATGDVLGFINSDDYLYPGALNAVAEHWNKGERWMVGWVMMLNPDGGEWPQMPKPMVSVADWFVTNPVPQQATFWAADLTRTLGGFDPDLHLVFDYEYWLRLRFRSDARPSIVHRCLGSYRLHASSKTMSEVDKYEPEFDQVKAIYAKDLSRAELREVRRGTRQFEAAKHKLLGWQALNRKDVPAARKHALQTVKNNGLGLEAWRLLYCAVRGH